jgi:hypothetical protein
MGSSGWTRIVLGAVFVLIAAIAGGTVSTPPPRAAMSWRNPVRIDQQLRISIRESQWPMVWLGEICNGPVSRLRSHQQMRNAAYAAACESKVKPGGEADNLMITRYANAMTALQDLHNEGYTCFVLRPWLGSFFLVASVAEDTVADARGNPVSASLEPLEVFGLPIQRGPNAPKPVGLERIPSASPELDHPTQTVREWISAVCEPPVHPLPDYTRLPHATDTASCRSLEKDGPPVTLVIARFPTEFLLQLDLGNEGYGFYAFAYDEGTMFTIATLSRKSVTNRQGLGVSPALEPLENFGFNVYSSPGLP